MVNWFEVQNKEIQAHAIYILTILQNFNSVEFISIFNYSRCTRELLRIGKAAVVSTGAIAKVVSHLFWISVVHRWKYSANPCLPSFKTTSLDVMTAVDLWLRRYCKWVYVEEEAYAEMQLTARPCDTISKEHRFQLQEGDYNCSSGQLANCN